MIPLEDSDHKLFIDIACQSEPVCVKLSVVMMYDRSMAEIDALSRTSNYCVIAFVERAVRTKSRNRQCNCVL